MLDNLGIALDKGGTRFPCQWKECLLLSLTVIKPLRPGRALLAVPKEGAPADLSVSGDR